MVYRNSTYHWTTLAAALPLLALGCPSDDAGEANDDTVGVTVAADDGGTDAPATDGPEPTADDATPEDTGSTDGTPTQDDADDDDPGPVVFDLGGIPDAPPPMESACQKVDFLFIIDNSSSMQTYQANLVASFPGFINGILGTLDSASSYQVGVITTDNYGYGSPGCAGLSSLVSTTGGNFSSNMVCGPFDDGGNFMTEADNLASAFGCAAQVGTSGSGNEQPMQAMIEAVQRVDGGPGQCNDGFLRDDSLLVIVNIGDEFDNSPGTPQTWYDDVVAARGDIPENVVIMSIIDGPTAGCGGGQSVDRSVFTALWGDNGFEVPICTADYGPFFEEAIAIIDGACENFVPPTG